jgi:hypothetical protein
MIMIIEWTHFTELTFSSFGVSTQQFLFSELSLSQFRERADLTQYSWVHFEGRKGTEELVNFVNEERLMNDLRLTVSVEIEKTDRGLDSLFPLADLVPML